ncbi:MAG: chain-length determining protein [Proteobacteria bacterium]|nr:MAG: chain-length determining protein [Pseudomonadota bacterium]
MSNLSRVAVPHLQDEADLFSVLRELWRRRSLVLGAGLLAAALGAACAFLITPEYEVSTVLRPAALNELDALNRSEVYSLPPGKALIRLGAALDSYDTRLSYFRSKTELVGVYTEPGETPEQAFQKFNKSLKLVQPDPKKADLLTAYIGLKMSYEKGIDGAELLNEFVDYAINNERIQLSNDLKAIVRNRVSEVDAKLQTAFADYESKKEARIARLLEADAIKRAELQDELKALRVQLKMRRDARLALLDESLSIARGLGLKKPATPSSMAVDESSATNVIRTEVNSQQVPLYFMGSDVLGAERKVLQKRSSDDFTEPRIAQIRKELIMLSSNREVEALNERKNELVFLDGIEPLRAERARLEAIKTDLSQMQLVSVDQLATAPTKPVKPNKFAIVIGALLAGLILGVFIALVRATFKTRLRHASVQRSVGEVNRVDAPVMVVS